MTKQRGGLSVSALVTLLTLLLVISVASWLWFQYEGRYLLPVKWVRIHGATEHVQQQDLKRTLLPLVTQGFLALDLQTIKQRLLQLPWIAQVQIKRQWPDTLFIGIVEQRAAAVWNQHALLNPAGKIFTPATARKIPANLPRLQGPADLSKVVLAECAQFDQLLLPLNLQVANLALSDRRAWQLTLSNGLQLNLGRTQVTSRLARFIALYPRLDFTKHIDNIAYIDLRYPNGFAVKWKSTVEKSS